MVNDIIPTGSKDVTANQATIGTLSHAITTIFLVYNENNTYKYTVDGIDKIYNVDSQKRYEFSHLLYEISKTDIGKAAIEQSKKFNNKMAIEIDYCIGYGKEKINEYKKYKHESLITTVIAEAIRDIIEIKDHKIFTDEALQSIISELKKTEYGDKSIEVANKRFGNVPSNIMLEGSATSKPREIE